MTSENKIETPTRRIFLGTSAATLSAGAIALLGGQDVFAAGNPTDTKSDITILNVAVGLEYEGINAYEIALKSGLLNAQHVKAATKFQDDHKQHNDALIATIRKLGGEPVQAKTLDEYVKQLKVDQLKNEDDVLDLAARLELGATNAYLGVITVFKDPALGKIAARLAADEASHFALLNFDLKRPFSKAFAFGA
ncbi:ferritin-like domain-containing protein [Undibacterium sp. SXout20W]|uniref:ferritin-like domain-containing protein n=1 Tax=Undibacterium sp. SXout20W TaxID=3413051 RepID=UPI003BF44A7F